MQVDQYGVQAPPLQIVTKYDEEARIVPGKAMTVTVGSDTTSFNRIPANNWSDSQITITLPNPNNNMLLSRKMEIMIPLYVVVQNNTALTTLPDGSWFNMSTVFGVKSYPISQTLISLQPYLNNWGPNQPQKDIVNWIGAIYRNSSKSNLFESTATQPNGVPLFSDDFANALPNICGYGESDQQTADLSFLPRMSKFWFTNSFSADFKTCYIQIYLVEELYIPPFLVGDEVGPALVGMSNINIIYNFGNWRNALYLNTFKAIGSPYNSLGAAGLSIPVATIVKPPSWPIAAMPPYFPPDLPDQPTFYFRQLTPLLRAPIPPAMTYPQPQIVRQVFPVSSATVGAFDRVLRLACQTTSITINNIPDFLIFFFRPADESRGPWLGDVMPTIQFPLNITFNNQQNIFSSANTPHLNRQQKKNGIVLSDTALNGCYLRINSVGQQDAMPSGGCPFIAAFGTDIGLPENQVPGSAGQYPLSIYATAAMYWPFTLASGATPIVWNFELITVNSGYLTVMNNQATAFILSLSNTDALAIPSLPSVPHNHIRTFYGGGFWSGVKNFFTTLGSVAKEALPYVKTGVNVAERLLAEPGAGGGYKKRKFGHY